MKNTREEAHEILDAYFDGKEIQYDCPMFDEYKYRVKQKAKIIKKPYCVTRTLFKDSFEVVLQYSGKTTLDQLTDDKFEIEVEE